MARLLEEYNDVLDDRGEGNAVKCNDTFSVRPICIGDSVVECVKSYKLLGVYIDNDL